jgi:hypothetical protein
MQFERLETVKQEIIGDALLKQLLERANAEADNYSDDDDESSDLKRPRLNDDERLQRWYVCTGVLNSLWPLWLTIVNCLFFSRERNRVHARNTRERKRAQMDLLQQRIQELADEVSFSFQAN